MDAISKPHFHAKEEPPLRNQSPPASSTSRAKVIGPFDGNNNNDGDLLLDSLHICDPMASSAALKSNKDEKMEYNMSVKFCREDAGSNRIRSSPIVTPHASPVAKRREAKQRPEVSHRKSVPAAKDRKSGSSSPSTSSTSSELGALAGQLTRCPVVHSFR